MSLATIWSLFTKVLDICIVWILFYFVLKSIRNNVKMVLIVKGVLIIILIEILSKLLNLYTVGLILEYVVEWGPLAIIVIFQPEIRRGLERLGRTPIFSGRGESAHAKSVKMVQELDKAIQYMSKRRIGALITIQQDTGLDDYIETGIKLDADITGELLINIFIPNTPLHDGAVIINNNRIAVAAAYLPLSDSSMIPKRLGTRHRAAVGISEVTDAVTIVVSEETGGVTITKNGRFLLDLTREEYLKYLNAQLVPKEEKKIPWIRRVINKVWKWGAGR